MAEPLPVPTQDEIRELERQRLASLVGLDFERADALHADEYELVPPGGVPLSRTSYLGGLKTGELRYEVFEAASEPRVQVFAGAAVVRYQARILIRIRDGFDEGLFWHTDLWAHRDGRWQAVWSQATRVPSGSVQ